MSVAVLRLLAIADAPSDDEDARLRKRVGVAAGIATIVAPLSLPFQAPAQPLAIVFGVALALYSAVNLVVLARTRDIDRFVVALIAAGVVFVPTATFLGGGITGSSTGLVWGFLVPAYAIMALGPRRATPWFVGYLGMVALMVVVDPAIRGAVGPVRYEAALFGTVQNAVMPLAIVFVLLRYTDLRRRAAEARVDELLTNAIPVSIVARLKRGERKIAEAHPAATVLFADIVGFTPYAQRTPPDQVVALLDELFSAFDDLTARHGLEKIKTIGDAYMATAGVPEPRRDHADAALALGREMITAVRDVRERTGVDLHIRVGISTGPVVAGVIGRQRLLFDLWGDTVNFAARMESFGVTDRIQLSASTWEGLAHKPPGEARVVDVKGLGTVTTYLVA